MVLREIISSGLTSLLLSTSLNLSKCALTAARLSSSTNVNRLWTARDVILREVVVSMAEPWPAEHRWREGGREEKRISLSGAISVQHRYELLNRSDTRTRCIFPDDTSAHVDKFSIFSYVRVCKNALCGELNKFITHDLRRELGSLIQIISVRLLERKTRVKCVCSERSREGS